MPQNKQNFIMASLIGCIVTKLKNFEKKKYTSLEINNLEVKAKFYEIITKVFNCYRKNIVIIKTLETFVL